MDGINFINIARREVAELADVETEDVLVVWVSKALQNNKGLFAIFGSQNYYEVTYNGNRSEMYIDTYTKVSNHLIEDVD